MKAPSIALIYDRYKKAFSTKKASVEIRITYNKKQKYMSTGIALYPNQWKKNKVINNPDAKQLNENLDNMLVTVRKALQVMGDDIDIFKIPKIIDSLKENKTDFIFFCKERTIVRKYGKTPDNQKRYDRFLKEFIRWEGISTFNDITDKNIILFDEYLKKKNLKPYSKWNNYHRFLNSFIIDAINAGYLKRNPYKWVNIPKDKTSKSLDKCIAIEEMNKIMRTKMPTKSLERVRDLFVFQTFTCLSYSDLKEFNPDNMVTIRGMQVYTGVRKKTRQQFTIPLEKEALAVLQKYSNLLPVISNVKYNEYLKVVAQMCKIDKPISSHWARHTGATLLLNRGVPMNIVSRICGHSSIRITERIYAKLFDETVVDTILSLQ
jgi:site-specific recombinase XerD